MNYNWLFNKITVADTYFLTNRELTHMCIFLKTVKTGRTGRSNHLIWTGKNRWWPAGSNLLTGPVRSGPAPVSPDRLQLWYIVNDIIIYSKYRISHCLLRIVNTNIFNQYPSHTHIDESLIGEVSVAWWRDTLLIEKLHEFVCNFHVYWCNTLSLTLMN